MRKIIPLLGLLLVTTTSISAQGNQTRPVVLKNHTIRLESFNGEISYTSQEIVNGNIYRIVQNGDEAYFNLSDKFSVEVLAYLPHNAFSVSIPTHKINEFSNLVIRVDAKVAQWQPEWKLSPNLFKQDIPEWAWVDTKNIEIWAQAFENISMVQFAALLSSQGFEITDEKPSLNMLAVNIKPENAIKLAGLPFVSYVQEAEDPGSPENYVERNNHRVNYLQAEYSGAPGYDGSGVTVGHGDDGALDYHVDFKGRLTQNSSSSRGDHGDHVAGTIFGAGNKDPRARGMAPGAEIYYQSYPNNLDNVDQDFINQNVRITSSSYSDGCNDGYTSFTRQMDLDMEQHPTLLHVFSAGNNGTSDCGYGAGSRWGNVTGGHKVAKNVVTVANITLVDNIANSSSRGPAEDGRIKPDVAAVGTSVYSTTDLDQNDAYKPNSYTNKTGTSMSCPGVSGTLATLYQAYRDVYNSDPNASLLKGILQNTSDDLGNPGPDFIYGYGRVNARRANDVIQSGQFMTDSITGSTKSFTINMPTTGTVKEVKIMLIWPDPAASLSAGKVLVNDLDLTVTQGTSNYLPLVLDPTPNPVNLNSDAIQARDSLNNVEQIVISTPSSSNITINVDAFNLPSAGQKFFITYEFVVDEVVLTYPVGGETFVPGTVEYIRWDSSEDSLVFQIEYSTDNGASWNSIINAAPSATMAIWVTPNIPTNKALVRITRGTQVSISQANFSILRLPGNPHFAKQCPDSATIVWSPASGANGYQVYKLGAKYMDSIAYTTDTFYTFAVNNPTTTGWYSVSSTLDSIPGQRVVAFEKPTTIFNCSFEQDIEIAELVSPQAGYLSDCFDYSQSRVKVSLKNNGSEDVYDFDLSYKINNQTTVTETHTDTLSPGASTVYEFSPTIGLTAGSNYYISVWNSLIADENQYNDSVNELLILIPGAPVTPPYYQDFESFSQCSRANSCGDISCTLTADWLNAPNYSMDDIDWRTNSGTTSTTGTGPSIDANPGNSFGKYLYLESSGNCDSNEAILISPCIDLTDTTLNLVTASYEYHMLGATMGTLNLDIITESEVIKNAHATISRNQGTQWKSIAVNLTPYVGQKVLLRFRGKTGTSNLSDIAIDNFKVENSGIGLKENVLHGIALFPNPNTGKFSITLSDAYSGEISFKVTSATGQVVYQKSEEVKSTSNFDLNLSNLSKGAYFVTVTTEDGNYTLKMLKH